MSEETIRRQQEALITAIKELEKREVKRLNRLATCKSRSDHQALHDRFDRERQMEKEKVEQLMSDYFVVEQQLKKSDVQSFLEERKTLKKTQLPSQRENIDQPNRFEGIETHTDMIFHSDVVRKFEKHDKRFQARLNHVPYDPVKEERKLRLLNQKRDLLQNLIKLQGAADGSGVAAPTARRAYDAYSVASGSSSGASYATFASSRTGNAPSSTAVIPRPNRVPKLHL
eukprot:gene2854-2077_t